LFYTPNYKFSAKLCVLVVVSKIFSEKLSYLGVTETNYCKANFGTYHLNGKNESKMAVQNILVNFWLMDMDVC
jgi:hypothetical protein